MTEQAHARAGDRATSHAAAAAITPMLPLLQGAIERYALGFPAGFTDVDLLDWRGDKHPSTLRSRRAELTARNIILDSGRTVIPEGHAQRHTVWIHRSFVDDPPPLAAKVSPPSKCDKGDALSMATKLDGYAEQLRKEGRAFLHTELIEAARLLRAVAR